MKRSQALRTLLGTVLVTSTAGTAEDVFQAEFKRAWKRSRDYTLTTFNLMPEEHMGFKPMPEMFAFRTQFTHCITYTTAQLAGRLGVKDPYADIQGWAQKSKAEIAAELDRFYEWVGTTIAKVPAVQLAKQFDFVGESLTGKQLCYALENHIIHHRGQAIVYLRLKGVTPESYFGW